MQSAMNRLRRSCDGAGSSSLGVWIVLLLVSIPFASQPDREPHRRRLRGARLGLGGGRQARSSASRAPAAEPLGVVLDNSKGGDAAAVQAAVDRVDKAAREGRRRRARPAAAAPAKRAAAQDAVVLLPLAVDRRRATTRSTPPTDLREELDVGEVDATASSRTSSASRRCGPACRSSEGGPREGRAHRLPDRPDRPAGRLRLARCAALLPLGARLRRRDRHRRGRSTSSRWRSTMSVFVTNIASMLGIGVAVDYSLFVLARYREELHGGRRPRRGARRRDAHLRPRRGLLRRDRDRLARRAVPDRLDGRCARWRSARSSSSRSRSSPR